MGTVYEAVPVESWFENDSPMPVIFPAPCGSERDWLETPV